MAENIDLQIQMKKIPVFTVLKNGSILKNIFLLHKQSAIDKSSRNHESDEEILLVGRHPHCNITLEHPSISRYHLRIHSIPSSHTLSVVDLSSVHGTWVSGKRIKPGVNVKLTEGDTVKLGGSSRIYELHWVPVSQAYDVDGQFVHAIYTIKEVEEETNLGETCETRSLDDDLELGEEETNQGETCETRSSDDDLECLNLSLSYMIQDSPSKTLNYSCDDADVEHSSQSKTDNRTIPAIEDSDVPSMLESQSNWSNDYVIDDFELIDHEIDKDDPISIPDCSKSSCDDTVLFKDPTVVTETIFETEISDSLKESEDELNWLRDNLSNEFELQNHEIINNDPFSASNLSKSSCEVEPGNENGGIFATVPVQVPLVLSESLSSDTLNKSKDHSNWLKDDLFSLENCSKSSCCDETEISDSLNKLEDHLINNLSNEFEQMNQTKMADDKSPSMIIFKSIDDEVMEKEAVFVGHTDEQTFTLKSKAHMRPEAMKNLPVSVNLFDSLDEDDMEIYTPGKENRDPNAHPEKSLKKRFNENDIFSFSEKETKSQTVDDQSHDLLGVAKKRWIMIVDTSSLVHAESLKHLRLLQGLKGTQLFIPKIVVRELKEIENEDDNVLKRSTRRKVSLALKWIEECTVNTKWWIHINDEIKESQLLENALCLRKEIKDRKIIILSNDCTLKIKSMTKGIMCEEAGEFYKSLVNPFSDRFMWVGSSARGLTWSCANDDIVRNKYHGSGLNGSKGLKIVARVTSFR